MSQPIDYATPVATRARVPALVWASLLMPGLAMALVAVVFLGLNYTSTTTATPSGVIGSSRNAIVPNLVLGLAALGLLLAGLVMAIAAIAARRGGRSWAIAAAALNALILLGLLLMV